MTPAPDEPTADKPADDGAGATPAGPAERVEPVGPTESGSPAKERNRRRWWIAGIAAGAALLVLLVCGGMGLAVAGFRNAVRSAEQQERGYERVDAACVELERRLNRVAPPGSTIDLKGRAAAIRAENAAVRPFLAVLDSTVGGRDDDDDRGERRRGRWHGDWAQMWQQLVAARVAYADALDRQAAGGEPAFFLPPRTAAGRSVTDRLENGPQWCAPSVRRLAAPDL